MTKKLFLPLWGISSFFLFLYSFTQVDLSLTLSSASIFQCVQKGFQYIGWFNRPLSTYLYIAIFALLFGLYFWSLRLVSKNKLDKKVIWKTIFIITVVLTLSYNAFSYDLFNYIFDARIVSFYNQNPYIHKALDFPNDPMLSFMHWTHRTYPYGPVWLALTVPITFITQNIFILTFYLFKILIASFFILTVWAIGKISDELKLKNSLLPVVAFAFNPFVVTESLVSAHNDIVMMGLALFGIYFLLRKERIRGSIIYALSIGVKFATALIIIGYFILLSLKKTKYFIGLSLIFMIAAVILATMRTNFQPWYLLYVFPFAALMIDKKYIRFPFYIFSIANIIYYIPYLHEGTWDPPIPSILNNIMIFSIIISIISASVFLPLWNKRKA